MWMYIMTWWFTSQCACCGCFCIFEIHVSLPWASPSHSTSKKNSSLNLGRIFLHPRSNMFQWIGYQRLRLSQTVLTINHSCHATNLDLTQYTEMVLGQETGLHITHVWKIQIKPEAYACSNTHVHCYSKCMEKAKVCFSILQICKKKKSKHKNGEINSLHLVHLFPQTTTTSCDETKYTHPED